MNSLRVIVRAPNFLGDHVMASFFYRALRESFPEAHLTLLSTENVAGLAYPEIFNAVEVIPSAERRGWGGVFKTARRLMGKYDLAISLPASLGSGLIFRFARIPERVGFTEPLGAWLYNRSRPWSGVESGRHKSELYLELLTLLDKPHAGQRLHAAPISAYAGTENRVVVAPLASIELREWPYFEALIVEIRRRYPSVLVSVVGTPHEKWSKQIAALGDKKVEDRLGKTSLESLVRLCASSKLVVANDSGVGHVAGTLAESPTLVLFGPGKPDYIRPIGPRVYDLRLETLPCSPCESATCRAPYGYQKCLKDLSLEIVLAKIATLLPPATP